MSRHTLAAPGERSGVVMSPRGASPGIFVSRSGCGGGRNVRHPWTNISFWGAGNMLHMKEVIWFDKVQLAEVSSLTTKWR